MLSYVVSFAPQLVLMDISIPFFNGYHWCSEIRRVSKVPIVFLSSTADNMNIVMAMNMGGDDFIAKPFDLTVLTAKVQALLRRAYDFGGQKQRAAVARAIITTPQLILADEPTGYLDSHGTDGLLNILNGINEEGQTILMVTHSTKAASHGKRVLFIKDGRVFHQIYKGAMTNKEMYEKIAHTLTVIATGGGHNG